MCSSGKAFNKILTIPVIFTDPKNQHLLTIIIQVWKNTQDFDAICKIYSSINGLIPFDYFKYLQVTDRWNVAKKYTAQWNNFTLNIWFSGLEQL